MAVTMAIGFPLGRYHATPWNRSVNEGAVEWPPSPWRLLRALISTWYTRWPELPAPALDALLARLGDPPWYRTPPAKPGHSRHYLPDLDHRKGETGRTDLALDPYLSLPRRTNRTTTDATGAQYDDADLLVRWENTLDDEQRQNLAKLVELLPYLGRADSVCRARLLDIDPEPDDTWWRPGTGTGTGQPTVRLLGPVFPVSRPALEVTPFEVRRSRRTTPMGTRWLDYTRTEPTSTPTRRRTRGPVVTAIRLAVQSRVPLKATHGILLADEIHRLTAKKLPEGSNRGLFGADGAATDHRHAHWIPIPDGAHQGATVDSIVVWSPTALEPDAIRALTSIGHVSGRRGGGRNADRERGNGNGNGGVDYAVKGLPPVDLLLQAAGAIEVVAPELCGPARRWRSLTPYLPVRHQKRESLDEFLARDIAAELGYRDLPAATVTRVEPDGGYSDRWSLGFRRYRMNEHLGQARRGVGLRLDFGPETAAQPPAGPLLLGQLSHFGYGIFIPEPE